MKCKHYESLVTNEKEECFACNGTGVFRDMNDMDIECPYCDGEGEREIHLAVCPNCSFIVNTLDRMWVNDRYGIPFKCVCSDCYHEVRDEIISWEFDECYAGESLEEEEW